MAEPATPYTEGFFTGNARSSIPSAGPVLSLLQELYAPTSIVDVGCGSGAWLMTAESLGFTTLKGYDGPWADPARYTSSAIDFTPIDLEHNDLVIEGRYDLAMSVEVAEHLSAARADVIVDALCGAADVVLFGAAVAGQGGAHHVNEQPQSYWVAKFAARGFTAYDVIRPAIWDNPEVKVWFRQNTLLYVKDSSTVLDPGRLRELERPIWDLIHPDKYQLTLANRAEKWATTKRELQQQNRRLRAKVTRLSERNRELRTRNTEIRGRSRQRRDRNQELRQRVNELRAQLAAERQNRPFKRLARGVSRRLRR